MPGQMGEALPAVTLAMLLWLAGLTFWVWRLHRKRPGEAADRRGTERDPPPLRPVEMANSAHEDERSFGPARSRGTGLAEARHPFISDGLRRPKEAFAPDPRAPREDPSRHDAVVDRVVSDFNRLAVNFTPEMLSQFEDRWQPRAIAEEGEGRFAAAPGGPLWFVLTDKTGRQGLILPGAEIVRKWEKFYRNLGGVNAPPGLDGSYALVEGRVLAILSPARASEVADGIRLTGKGELAGT